MQTFPSITAAIAALKPQEPVYCWHPAALRRNAAAFLDNFTGDTLYAVKANPHPYVLQKLYDAGIRHFDTASLAEIKLVKDLFPDAHCYFMHPVKTRHSIYEAYHTYGLRDFVLDHPDELAKMQAEIPLDQCTVYVRIAPPSTTAVYDFSNKFGARGSLAVELLQAVAATGARVAVSFHIGSQCLTPDTFATTLDHLNNTLSAAGIVIDVLDIGGGFPAEYGGITPPPLADFFTAINHGLADLPQSTKPRLLCEPGRALVATGCSIILQVLLRKRNLLYINDGVYGSFSEVWTGKLGVPMELIKADNAAPSPLTHNFTLYGWSCDSVDMLPLQFALPDNVAIDDWLVVHTLGAYSNAIASHFNGFFPDTYVEIA